MARKLRDSGVRPALRRDWLKRSEEYGESALDIARKDGYDVRTVRKQIAAEKEVREVKEARSVVLRSALEEHYRDLCRFAEVLKDNISGVKRFAVDSTDMSPGVDQHLETSLREHLPRSPIWKLLKERTSLLDQMAELNREAVAKIEAVKADPRLGLFGERMPAVSSGLAAFLKFQLVEWSKGYAGLNIESDVVMQPIEDGLFAFGYGGFHTGNVRREEAKVINEIAEDWQVRIREWEEFKKLVKTRDELKDANDKLIDELTTITLRRVVPGRCRYCPI